MLTFDCGPRCDSPTGSGIRHWLVVTIVALFNVAANPASVHAIVVPEFHGDNRSLPNASSNAMKHGLWYEARLLECSTASTFVELSPSSSKEIAVLTDSPRVLVTGGYGCIGVQTVKWLLTNTNASVVVGSRDVSTTRTQRLFHDTDCAKLKCVVLDVRTQQHIEHVLTDERITHVIHLAALQTPDCNAHRDLGLQINLAGTQNVIEAIKTCQPSLQRFVFASSIAVYGPRSAYAGPKVPMLAEPQPVNVYGAWKLAGENISRMFCLDTGIPTVSLRPGVLFGPGRDAGLTSTPTTAMKSVALEVPYEIPFRSRQDYLYAPDVGAAFGNAAVAPFTGYGAFTLPSHTVNTAEVVDTMRNAAHDLGLAANFAITVGSEEVPFICDLTYEPFLHAFPETSHTPLEVAVKESLEAFRMQRKRGWLKS